jgi:hypothetical protein
MRRLIPVLALVSSLAATGSPAIAAPHEYHVCPAEARGAVSHSGDGSWVATPQSSRLIDTRVAPIGGIVALVCVYHMFGGEYWIYKRPEPGMTSCFPYTNGTQRGFDCTP